MPNLNNTQKNFRKQMKELEQIKTYKEIIDDHNNFYDNTAYKNEIKEKKLKKQKATRNFIILIILIFVGNIIYNNIDLIKSQLSTHINNSKANNVPSKLINNQFFTDNEIKQYEIGTYHKNYGKKIDSLQTLIIDMVNQDNFNNYSREQLIEQINNIDSITIKFNNYKPKDLESSLHNLNIQKLNLLKDKLKISIELKNDYYNNQLRNSLNLISNNINIAVSDYRIEMIRIFNDINMEYYIDENGIIEFTYKSIY